MARQLRPKIRPSEPPPRFQHRVALAKAIEQPLHELDGKLGLIRHRLQLDWVTIVGEDLAKLCHPLSLRMGKHAASQGQAGEVTLAVNSAAATLISYQASSIIEKINFFFGKPVTNKLRLVHESPAQSAARLKIAASLSPPAPLRPLPSQMAVNTIANQSFAHIKDDELRATLARLSLMIKENNHLV